MLCLLLVGRKRKEKKEEQEREKWPGGFFPGPDTPYWLCHMGLSWLLGAIKG
jgi:hypothetical protein